MSTNDGGPAFPHIVEPVDGNPNVTRTVTYGGMSLRDYFSAKAMQGMLANTSGKTFDSRVKRAWEIADAMLAARSKP